MSNEAHHVTPTFVRHNLHQALKFVESAASLMETVWLRERH